MAQPHLVQSGSMLHVPTPMSMNTFTTAPKRRREGACDECAQRKRKCDQQKPKCSECLKHNRHCALQTFKTWDGQGSFAGTRHTSKVKTRKRSDKRPRNSLSIQIPVDSSNSTETRPTVQVSEEISAIAANSETPVSRVQNSVTKLPTSALNISDYADIENTIDLGMVCTELSEEFSESTACVPLLLEKGPVERQFTNSPLNSTLPLSNYGHVFFQSPVFADAYQEGSALWGHFVINVTKWFLCCGPNDISRGADFQDPYTVALPQLAMESPTLRLAALALSASQYTAGGSSSKSMEQLALSMGFEAYQNIAARKFSLSDDRRQSLILVVAAAFLLLLDPTTYSSVLSISREAAAFVTATRDPSSEHDDVGLSANLQLFRWVDLCAQCSLIKFVPLSTPYVHGLLELDEWELNLSLPANTKKSIIHPMWSFSRRYINPLIKLARLIRVKLNEGNFAHDQTDNLRLDNQIEELEQILLDAREADLKDMAEHTDHSAEILHLNTAICSAVELLFYTRLKDVAWTTPFVRCQVKIIYDNISHIPPDKPTSLGVIFPLYCAGLEAVDMEARDAISARLRSLPGYWSFREGRIVASLLHVWDIRDQYPGDTWTAWACKVRHDIADCVPV